MAPTFRVPTADSLFVVIVAVRAVPNPRWSTVAPAIWAPGQPNLPTVFPAAGVANQLSKVNNLGYAVGEVNKVAEVAGYLEEGFVVSGNTVILELKDLGIPIDINNHQFFIGNTETQNTQAYIWNVWGKIFSKKPIFLPPLPGTKSVTAAGINDNGDVVGNSDSTAFLYTSASGMSPVNVGEFYPCDINVNRLAVGDDNNNLPVFVDLSDLATAELQSITLPKPFISGTATAVNKNGTIVGNCESRLPLQSPYGAFVYYASSGKACNLNDLLYDAGEYTIWSAFDINDAGQIVGSATKKEDANSLPYAYVATPRPEPHLNPWTAGAVVSVLGGVGADGGGIVWVPGGPPMPIPPWGPEALSNMSAAQIESLLRSTISDLAEHLSSPDARRQIQAALLESAFLPGQAAIPIAAGAGQSSALTSEGASRLAEERRRKLQRRRGPARR